METQFNDCGRKSAGVLSIIMAQREQKVLPDTSIEHVI